MNIKKTLATLLVVAGVASAFMAKADPRPSKPITTIPLKTKFVLPSFKPNLIAKDLGWSGEFCNRSKCFREFKQFGFNKATCKFSVRVVNLGRGAAGRFRVKLEYRMWNGNMRRTSAIVNSLKRNGLRGSSKLVYFNVPNYKLGQLMKVTVDSSYQVSETNEGDNTAHYRTTY